MPLNATLKQYTDFAWNFLNLTLTDFNPIQRNSTSVSGIPAESNTYTYLDEFEGKDETIKTLEVITVFENRAYKITFSSPQFDFDDLLPTVQKIINSIKILPMPPCHFIKNETMPYGGACELAPP